ncbi:MAG: type II toxin-antitoxin system RelE/ParE family toxin [Smithella sp.]
MAYSIDLKPEASKKLNSFDKEMHRRILKAIIALAENPRPSGCAVLTVEKRYRIRVGDFRIVYEIHDSRLLVLVVRIGHRRSVYR